MSELKSIDMSRPTTLYLSLSAILLFMVFIEGRVTTLISIPSLHLPFQQYIATGILMASIGFGILGAQRHSARIAEPWRVPQVQALLCFILFFILGLTSIYLSL